MHNACKVLNTGPEHSKCSIIWKVREMQTYYCGKKYTSYKILDFAYEFLK